MYVLQHIYAPRHIYASAAAYGNSSPAFHLRATRPTSGIALPLPDPLIPTRKVPHLVAFSGPSFGSLRLVTCPFCVCRRVTCFGIDTIDARRDEWVFDHPRLGGVLRGSGGAYRRHRRCSRSTTVIAHHGARRRLQKRPWVRLCSSVV